MTDKVEPISDTRISALEIEMQAESVTAVLLPTTVLGFISRIRAQDAEIERLKFELEASLSGCACGVLKDGTLRMCAFHEAALSQEGE